MAQVEVVEGHPDIPEESRKKLSPGAQARIYRDGNVLEGACLIPQKGDLELRHLAPGSYVVKDETGGYEEFKVLPKVETVAVPTRYSASQDSKDAEIGSGEPGSSSTTPKMELRDNQVELPSPSVQTGPPKLGAETDVPVLAEPGSALIEELPDPDDTPDGNLERLKRTSNEDKAAKDELKGTSRRKVSKKKQEEPTAEEIQSGQPEDEKRDVVASEPNDGDNLPGVTGAEAWQELKAKASSHAETTEKAPKGKGK